MRILLDECMPLRLTSSVVFAGHRVDHVSRSGVSGLDDQSLLSWASQRYELFITSDRHFRQKASLRPSAAMGVVCVRIAPNTLHDIEPALVSMFRELDVQKLVGKLVVLWRDKLEVVS